MKLAVFTVWTPMLLGDSRDAWDPSVLPDNRVVHLWDAGRLVGRWFGANQPPG
jgi:hypothetical protein